MVDYNPLIRSAILSSRSEKGAVHSRNQIKSLQKTPKHDVYFFVIWNKSLKFKENYTFQKLQQNCPVFTKYIPSI